MFIVSGHRSMFFLAGRIPSMDQNTVAKYSQRRGVESS